jgi:pilus assembly protein FimV
MMRKKLPAGRAVGAQKSRGKPQWRATALAVATAVLVGLSATDANALALGRITVQSALGEPMRAEIDVPDINPDELASLRATIASPEAFRAAGFDYNPAMGSIQVTLQRRPDGRHYLQLSSHRPINDPFVDLILEASWSSGRIVRDYTMLFDPPNLRQGAPAVAAQVPPATTPAASTPAAPHAAQPGGPATAQPAEAAARAPEARQPAVQSAADGKQVTVQSGDTAGRIAAANKPAHLSLDQMLVALLQANPQAFVQGNVNRLKAGAVLDIPTAEQAEAIPAGEARRTIIAQSRDFNDFRRRLAEGLPASPIAGSERQTSGRVQTQVEEKKPAAATPDKLMLSKGAVQGKGAADKIARERAARDDATRLAELNKNIADLNKLGTATGPVASGKPGTVTSGIPTPPGIAAAKPASAPTAAAPAVLASAARAPASTAVPATSAASATPAKPASAPATTAAANALPSASGMAAAASAAAPITVAAASAPATESATAAATPTAAASATSAAAASAAPAPASAAVVATAAAVSASKPKVAPARPPEPETSLVDDLLENPIVPASVGGVLALLLGFGFYRAQQRKKSTQVDSSFLESRLQPDSFFGASGGQRVDTNESSNATGSSMVYSPSQLDAAGDVDPVAEADVYLAYGRDLQAEEILKEAIRITPQRVAVHTKLLEIYAKRRDAKAFGQVAAETYNLTRGEGTDWDHICELGQELDASNALYRPGGRPTHATGPAQRGAPADEFGSQATQVMPVAAAPDSVVDLDLDLDFSIGDESPEAGQSAGRQPAATDTSLHSTQKMERPPVVEPVPSLDMDFGSAGAPGAAPSHAVQLEAPDLNLSAHNLSSAAESSRAPAAAKPAPAADAGMIEFDLGALSLDLDTQPAAAAPRAPVKAEADEGPVSTAGAPLNTGAPASDDPLATKLALAQEFNAIGDPDGARSLAEEVLAAASGDLKQKAQRFLAEIA